MDKSLYFLALGFTEDAALFTSKAIRRVTGGPSHVVVLVREISPNGRQESYYFESIAKADAVTHKSGVRGPIPLSRLSEWVDEKPSRSLLTVPDKGYLPLTQEEAADAVRRLRDAVPTTHYAHTQLGQNLLARIGVRFSLGGGSDKAWTCCETPLRAGVLPPRWWGEVGMADVNADEFWPGGSSRYSLMAAVQRVIAAHGTVVV